MASFFDAVNAEDVTKFFELGAKVDEIRNFDFFNFRPLDYACYTGNYKVADALINYGADLDGKLYPHDLHPPISWACEGGYVKIVERLVNAGSIVEFRSYEYDPLIIATDKEHIDVIDYLLSIGVNPNGLDDCDETPLIVACGRSSVDAVDRLLAAGADVDCNKSGETVLINACYRLNVEIVDRLLCHGANPNIDFNKVTTTPLLASLTVDISEDPEMTQNFTELELTNKRRVIVEKLLGMTADPNQFDRNKYYSPLHRAASQDDLEIVKMLVEYGADVTTRDYRGRKPSEITKNPEIIDFLTKVENEQSTF